MPDPATLSIPPWRDRILVQARPTEVNAVASLCAQENMGAVFVTGKDAKTRMRAVVDRMRNASDTAALLFDANRYSGKSRTFAAAGLSPEWIAMQYQLGASWALTDSGYIADGDVDGLRLILKQTKAIDGGVTAVLPLARSWWTPDSRAILLDLIGTHAVPVALILEHKNDPFSAIGTVEGVVDLLQRSPVQVTLLRSDLSGLGVLAFGGTAAAIGTSSSLRHLYPIPTKDSKGGHRARISLLWCNGLAYRSLEKLTDAIAADPDALHWLCSCSVCYGRSLEWILNSTDPFTRAYEHSIATIRSLATNLDSPLFTAEERQAAWLEMCRVAQGYSYEVADLSGKSWEPPHALTAWNKAIPTPVA